MQTCLPEIFETAMKKEISLILHLERLAQNDQEGGAVACFSLNFSVAFDSDEALTKPEVLKVVQPWNWQIEKNLQMAAIKDGGATIKPITGELKLLPAVAAEPGKPDPTRFWK